MSPQQHRAMEYFQHRSYYGLGDARPITSAIGAGLVTAGGVIALVPAIGPIIGGIVAAVGALTGLIGGLFTPNLTNIQATHIVDQIEAEYLKPNLASWQSLPPEHKIQTVQAAHLALFDKAWDGVMQGCSNPALGTSGQRCISERQRGGSAPWCPNTGHVGCDWFALYRDPIANDPNVLPDPVAGSVLTSPGSVSGAVDSAVSSVSQALGGISPVWIGVGLIAAALLLVSD
jgi:hypothetical protein